MKTVTIELDNELERQLDTLSASEGRALSRIVLDVLAQGLSERQRRARTAKSLEELFAQSVPSPFNGMSEDEVMSLVEEEIRLQDGSDHSFSAG